MISQLNIHPIEFILTALLFTGLVHLLLFLPYDIYQFYQDKVTYAQVHGFEKGGEFVYVSWSLAIIAFSIVGILIIYLRLKKPFNNHIKRINYAMMVSIILLIVIKQFVN